MGSSLEGDCSEIEGGVQWDFIDAPSFVEEDKYQDVFKYKLKNTAFMKKAIIRVNSKLLTNL